MQKEGQISEQPQITFFWRPEEENGEFGQWWPCTFCDKQSGAIYNCAEQYMMAQKALLFGDMATHALIMSTTSPSEHKKLGQRVSSFDSAIWDRECREIVYRGNLLKFTQDPLLGAKLLATGNRILAEASPKDPRWGIGIEKSHPDAVLPSKWHGTNWLGETLMRVRNTLRVLNYCRK